MQELVQILIENNLTIGSCESLTGGLFASTFVSIPGASRVFIGSIVSYATRIKAEVVHVEQELIDSYGVVSKEVSDSMAKHIADVLACDVGVSFTGNAGPGVMEGKQAGLVYSSICLKGTIYSFEDIIELPRNELRNEIVNRMVQRLKNLIKAGENNGKRRNE